MIDSPEYKKDGYKSKYKTLSSFIALIHLKLTTNK